LPKLDIPINLLTWEVSLPDRLDVKQFGGNALAAEYLPAATLDMIAANTAEEEVIVSSPIQNEIDISNLRPGQIGGIVVDANGASIPHANITAVNKQTGAKWSTQSDADGRWVIANALPGPTRVSVDSSGFKTTNQELNL